MISSHKLLKQVDLNREVSRIIFKLTTPKNYSGDPKLNYELIYEMINRYNYSFAFWEVPSFSSVMHMPLAAFVKSVRPVKSIDECTNDESVYAAFAPTMMEAICYAALFALENAKK